jgi:hypothetical protein
MFSTNANVPLQKNIYLKNIDVKDLTADLYIIA